MHCPCHQGQRVNQGGQSEIVCSSKMLIKIYQTTYHDIVTALITQDLTTGLYLCGDKIFMFRISEPGHSWMTWVETQTRRMVATKHHCMQHASWVSRSLSQLRSDVQHAWRFCYNGGEFPLTVGDENVLIFRLRTRYAPKIEGDSCSWSVDVTVSTMNYPSLISLFYNLVLCILCLILAMFYFDCCMKFDTFEAHFYCCYTIYVSGLFYDPAHSSQYITSNGRMADE